MEEVIHDHEAARNLARITVGAMARRHRQEVEESVVEDRLFHVLAPAIDEGRRHYEARVDPELHERGYFEKALVDHLLKPFGRIKSRIW